MELTAVTLDYNIPVVQDMFRDRAEIFGKKMGWDVNVDARGFEIDEYDIPNLTIYLIVRDGDKHLASLRLNPVQSACMAIDHFGDLCTMDMIDDPQYCAEVTRFCVSAEDPKGELAKHLMFANAKFIYESAMFNSCLGVFYPAMKRVYKRIGFEPVLLNEIKDFNVDDGKTLCVGQWTKERYEEILANAAS